VPRNTVTSAFRCWAVSLRSVPSSPVVATRRDRRTPRSIAANTTVSSSVGSQKSGVRGRRAIKHRCINRSGFSLQTLQIKALTRTSHQPSTATTYLALPALLRLVDQPRSIAENTPSAGLGRGPCRQYHLSRFATKAGEKTGLKRVSLPRRDAPRYCPEPEIQSSI
jgi:hypothetical protein